MSAGLWSIVAAIVGALAIAAGGTAYLIVEEIRGFALVVLAVGLALLLLALALSPRALAMSLAGRRGRYGVNAVVVSVAFFALIILVNLQIFRNPGRLDLTFTRAFTLAEQTVQALGTLDGPVRANAFFVPGESVQSRRQAEDLLSELDRQSDKFTYRFIDPEVSVSDARQYDVVSYPTIVIEDLTTGVQQPIGVFTEQELVTGILVATGEMRKRIYYLSDHGERSESGRAQGDGLDAALAGMRSDNYSVASLSLAETGEVPSDAAVVVVAGPKKDLSDSDAEALEAYIVSGGSVLGMFDPGAPDSFVRLIARWGVKLGSHSIADVVSNVGGEALSPLAQRSNAQFPTRTPGGTITDRLTVAFFPDVTSVETVLPLEEMPPDELISVDPLAITTPGSWIESDPERAEFDPNEDRRGPFPMAVAVEASGTLNGKERHARAKLIIFGDSDFASNRYFPSLDNADLLLNSVNWLAADFDLISIRPKVFPSRRLVVNRRELEFIKWTGWLFPPSVMLILGVYVWWRRR